MVAKKDHPQIHCSTHSGNANIHCAVAEVQKTAAVTNFTADIQKFKVVMQNNSSSAAVMQNSQCHSDILHRK